MDRQALQIIFSEYMRRFDELNDPLHAEYFKWIAAKKFKPAMDNALAAGSDDFAQKLNEAFLFEFLNKKATPRKTFIRETFVKIRWQQE